MTYQNEQRDVHAVGWLQVRGRGISRHPDATARLRKHPHFARIVTAVSCATRASMFTTQGRADFWEQVCYYNFLQEFLSVPRVLPSAKSWDAGKKAFLEFLAAVQPDVVVAFSKRLGNVLKPLFGEVLLASVHHPSSGFAYARWNPVIARVLGVPDKTGAINGNETSLPRSPAYRKWVALSTNASPAHGPHLPAERLEAVHAQWASEMLVARGYS